MFSHYYIHSNDSLLVLWRLKCFFSDSAAIMNAISVKYTMKSITFLSAGKLLPLAIIIITGMVQVGKGKFYLPLDTYLYAYILRNAFFLYVLKDLNF